MTVTKRFLQKCGKGPPHTKNAPSSYNNLKSLYVLTSKRGNKIYLKCFQNVQPTPTPQKNKPPTKCKHLFFSQSLSKWRTKFSSFQVFWHTLPRTKNEPPKKIQQIVFLKSYQIGKKIELIKFQIFYHLPAWKKHLIQKISWDFFLQILKLF